jgi:hypothetical protein
MCVDFSVSIWSTTPGFAFGRREPALSCVSIGRADEPTTDSAEYGPVVEMASSQRLAGVRTWSLSGKRYERHEESCDSNWRV